MLWALTEVLDFWHLSMTNSRKHSFSVAKRFYANVINLTLYVHSFRQKEHGQPNADWQVFPGERTVG